MRRTPTVPLLALLTVAAVLAVAASPAAAQTEGCTQAAPCTWFVSVTDAGFDTPAENRSVGDWIQIDATNFGEREHMVSLPAYGVNLRIEVDGNAVSPPFLLDRVGRFPLMDQPSGRQVMLTVVGCNTDEYEAGACDMQGTPIGTSASSAPATSSGKGGIPGFEATLLVAGLLALAIAARRR